MKPVMTGAEPDEVWPLVRDFHYSRRMPANIQHCYAVRAPGGFFGDTGEVLAASVFTMPPTRWSEPVIELARLVRHADYKEPLSAFLAFTFGWLRKAGHALLVSFADATHDHHGGIYQASNWRYAGQRESRMDGLIIDGQFKPGRSCNSAYGTRSPSKLQGLLRGRSIEPHYDAGKHLYWMPLTVAGKTRAKRLGLASLPYPKPDFAGRPVDALVPTSASKAQPLGPAPNHPEMAA